MAQELPAGAPEFKWELVFSVLYVSFSRSPASLCSHTFISSSLPLMGSHGRLTDPDIFQGGTVRVFLRSVPDVRAPPVGCGVQGQRRSHFYT